MRLFRNNPEQWNIDLKSVQKETAEASDNVTAVIILCIGSLRLSCLISEFTTSVPKGCYVKGVVLDIIDNFIEPADDDASIGLLPMGQERIQLTHRGMLQGGVGEICTYLLEGLRNTRMAYSGKMRTCLTAPSALSSI